MNYKKSYSLEKSSLELNSAKKTEQNNLITTTFPNGEDETNKEKSKKKKKNAFLGFFYTFLSTITFGLASVIVKKLPYITPGQLTFVRNAAIFAGSLPIAVACQINVFGSKKDRKILIARSILGISALYLNILAYTLLPLADAAIILSITPVVTILFARIFLREICNWTQSVSLVFTLIGILLSARLPELLKNRSDYQFDYNYISGIGASVGSVITLSLTFVTLRKMKDVHFSVPLFYFGLLGMIENAIISGIMVSYSPVNCGRDLFLYLSIGILAFGTNATLTLAFQVEAASVVSVVRSSSDIVLAILYQIVFFGDYPDVYNIAGGFLVISSLSILGVRNWLLSLPEDSETRKKMNFFLM